MKNKKDQRFPKILFLLFMLACTLFLMEHCQSVPSKYSKEVLSEKQKPPHATPPSIDHLEGVDLLGTVKGEFLYLEEKIRFRALLRISAKGKMRIEIFNPFGKMLSAAIFSQPTLSLYIPSQGVLYRGTGSSDNMFKLFGLKIEARKIVHILSGMEPFLVLKQQGLFQTVLIQNGSSWKSPLSDQELWLLARKGGSLILKNHRDDKMNTMEILSRYIPEPVHDKCFLIVPKEDIIFIEDSSVKLKIEFREIRSYLLYADGHLLCGFEEDGIGLRSEEIFNDRHYENMAGVDLIDLDRINIDRPLFVGE
jgi:hypothetical protein